MKIEWKSCFKIGVSIFILFLCIHYWTGVTSFLNKMFNAAFPLLIGCVIAYIINILMSFYERHFFAKSTKRIITKIRRPICLIGAILTLVAIISLVVSLVLPQLISCVQLIIQALPGTMEFLSAKVEGLNFAPNNISDLVVNVDWEKRIDQVIGFLTTGVGDIMNTVVKAVSVAFSGVVTTLLSVIFSIYLLMGKDKISVQLNNLMDHYLHTKVCNKVRYFFGVLNDSFHRYIVGQCTEAVVIGVLCTFGMMIFGFPYPAMIGTLIGFTALIPIAGAYIGAGVGAFMIFTVSPIQALWFLIFIIVLQQLEGNLIYPKVVGSSIGLPGIWVLAAVTVGGGIMGIAGMLIGVPIFATVYRIVSDDMSKERKEKKKFRIKHID